MNPSLTLFTTSFFELSKIAIPYVLLLVRQSLDIIIARILNCIETDENKNESITFGIGSSNNRQESIVRIYCVHFIDIQMNSVEQTNNSMEQLKYVILIALHLNADFNRENIVKIQWQTDFPLKSRFVYLERFIICSHVTLNHLQTQHRHSMKTIAKELLIKEPHLNNIFNITSSIILFIFDIDKYLYEKITRYVCSFLMNQVYFVCIEIKCVESKNYVLYVKIT